MRGGLSHGLWPAHMVEVEEGMGTACASQW